MPPPSLLPCVGPGVTLRGAMAEALGQRSVLGLGVVLLWLLLFHLLVNIWLLCVFTSLLVVLGGWLGSQAVLESDSVVHLERFIALEQVLPSAEDERHLDREIHSTVRKVIRDFVSSWFCTVSSESGFETQDFLRAKRLSAAPAAPWGDDSEDLWRAYSAVTTPHLATTGEGACVDYTRAAADLLLHVLVPPPHLESRTGRLVVGELVTCNVLLPLLAELSDPDWLNVLVVGMFGQSLKPQEPLPTSPSPSPSPPSSPPPPPAEPELAPPQETQTTPPPREALSDAETPEPSAYDAVDSEETDCSQSNAEEDEPALSFLRHYVRAGKPNPFYRENDSDLDSPLGDGRPGSVDSLVAVGREDEDGVEPEDGGRCPRVLVTSEGGGSPPASRELLLGVDPGEPRGSSPLQTFSFEPLVSPDGPVVIQNLRIAGTYETVGCETPGGGRPDPEEAESGPGGEEPAAAQQVAYHMVNRRYSEFLNLQTRLEEKTDLRRLIKGVKGPKKVFPEMPFGNMDSDKIEARKGLLEIFLKLLCAVPEVANSVEMQEFLALNTDARIAFVKKPFIVSRIDKIMVNAIVDTLKTAFPRSEPQSPTEDGELEIDGGKCACEKKSRSRLKFSGKGVPFMNGSDIRAPVSFSWEQTGTAFNGMSLGDLQAFIAEQEQRSVGPEAGGPGGPGGSEAPGWRRKEAREPGESR
ncbi:Sorting nexin-19 [Liparis tanakae]|uniref:Sorting nexin-19 n=1 Tax=Liparis tanakae TaxID=230148 RepID=A0A4Z2EWM1_9TELE|nr:Sorting nexin-19 [Liparis tanakae]